MLNAKHFYNLGYREAGKNEASLQRGFDEGFEKGMVVGLELGKFIAKHANSDEGTNAKDVKETCKRLKELIDDNNGLKNMDSIIELLKE
jgi:hypothetical protein